MVPLPVASPYRVGWVRGMVTPCRVCGMRVSSPFRVMASLPSVRSQPVRAERGSGGGHEPPGSWAKGHVLPRMRDWGSRG